MATIKPMGESPCSSAVSIQSSSLRIDLLLHFADKVLGVLNKKLCMGTVATDLYAAVFVRKSHASVRSPLGTERASQRVNFEVDVGLEDLNSLTEVLKRNVVKPCSESGYGTADAHVLSCEASTFEINALRDLDFVLVVNWFEFHFGYPHQGWRRTASRSSSSVIESW